MDEDNGADYKTPAGFDADKTRSIIETPIADVYESSSI